MQLVRAHLSLDLSNKLFPFIDFSTQPLTLKFGCTYAKRPLSSDICTHSIGATFALINHNGAQCQAFSRSSRSCSRWHSQLSLGRLFHATHGRGDPLPMPQCNSIRRNGNSDPSNYVRTHLDTQTQTVAVALTKHMPSRFLLESGRTRPPCFKLV